MHAKSLRSCLTLWDPMDCSPPGFAVHRILEARILEWVALHFHCISTFLLPGQTWVQWYSKKLKLIQPPALEYQCITVAFKHVWKCLLQWPFFMWLQFSVPLARLIWLKTPLPLLFVGNIQASGIIWCANLIASCIFKGWYRLCHSQDCLHSFF